MARYLAVILLDSFITSVKGDKVGKSEYYFKVNKTKYPDEGEINLKPDEIFDPEPNPVLYTAFLDDKTKEVEFKVEVKEDDVLRDDTIISEKLTYPLEAIETSLTIQDEKKTSTLKLDIKIEQVNW